MKRYNIALLLLIVAAAVFQACKRDYAVHAAYTNAQTSAYLKIVHASPNFRKSFKEPDSVNVFVGAQKINASVLKFNTVYPSIVNGYASVPAGTSQVRVTVGVSNPDSFTVLSMNKNLVAGSYYTLVITDSLLSTRDSSRIWLNDAYPKPAFGPGFTYLRFVHAVLNDSAGTTVNLYSPRRNQTLFSKVKIDSVTPFIPIPTLLATLDTLYVLKSNTGALLAKVLPTTFLGDQQYNTAYYIGDTLTSVGKPRTLVYYLNK